MVDDDAATMSDGPDVTAAAWERPSAHEAAGGGGEDVSLTGGGGLLGGGGKPPPGKERRHGRGGDGGDGRGHGGHGHGLGHGHDHHGHGNGHDHGHGDHHYGHDHGHDHAGHADHDHDDRRAGDGGGGSGGCCDHTHSPSSWRAYLPHSHSLSNRLSHDERTLRQVAIVLLVSISAQATGALAAHSGLLAVEAAHGLLDGLNVLLALLAVTIVARYPSSAAAPYGHGRVEVLSAAVGISALAGMVVKLSTSAVVRLVRLARGGAAGVPPAEGRLVMAAEAVTLAANGVMAWLLSRRQRLPPGADDDGVSAAEVSLNVRALRAHVIADCVENACVLAAGGVMWAAAGRGWVDLLDPLATLTVAAIVAVMNVGLVREVVSTLMQWAPPGVDVGGLGRELRGLDGVARVSGLRVWTLTSGSVVATVQLWTRGGAGGKGGGGAADAELLSAAERVLRGVGATETCVQVDHRALPVAELGEDAADVELGEVYSAPVNGVGGGAGGRGRGQYTPFVLDAP